MIRAELSMCERGVSGGRREEERGGEQKVFVPGYPDMKCAGTSGQTKWNFFFFPFSSAF